MRVKKLLDQKGHKVYSVSPDTTVYDALKLMAEKEIGALVVLEKKKMVGILSERDYARKIILKGKSSKETLVREIMTSEVIHTIPDKKVRKYLLYIEIIRDNTFKSILEVLDKTCFTSLKKIAS